MFINIDLKIFFFINCLDICICDYLSRRFFLFYCKRCVYCLCVNVIFVYFIYVFDVLIIFIFLE